MTNRSTILCSAALCLMAGRVMAFQPVEPASSAALPPPAFKEEEPWGFSASLTLYCTPDQNVYVGSTVTADQGALHLEARYNYEALDTGSIWVGYNFSAGGEEGGLSLDFTPMLGGVIGDVSGVAPGYELTLAWKGLELYTEGEFVFSTETDEDNFFYSWSQLTYAPVEGFRFGVAFQRTQAYDSGREVDVGPYIGVTFQHVDVSGWALNLDDEHPIYGLSVGIEF